MEFARRYFNNLDPWHYNVTVISLIVGLPLLLLSFLQFVYYQLLLVMLCLLVLAWLGHIIQVRKPLLLRMFVMVLILLTVVVTAFRVSPTFNFWLTASMRQHIVNSIAGALSGKTEWTIESPYKINDLLLGRATAYRYGSQILVYFDYYKRGNTPFNQAAFIVYASDPSSIDMYYERLTPLGDHWYFLLRAYYD